uniref:Uncharacterized protein n=1 Tax=Caenorhabditis japonica TaxID=281687 RepID=A0A8R1IIA7_CAEJA
MVSHIVPPLAERRFRGPNVKVVLVDKASIRTNFRPSGPSVRPSVRRPSASSAVRPVRPRTNWLVRFVRLVRLVRFVRFVRNALIGWEF